MKRKRTTTEFIDLAQKVHGNKYDYSKTIYINSTQKVCIICPQHGEFWQEANAHLQGSGCPYCAGKNKTTKNIIEEFRAAHDNKYDYSKVHYINNDTKVCIICPNHGEFWQTPHHHKNGIGCPKCGIEKNSSNRTSSLETFIQKAQEIHGSKYDYSKVEYITAKKKVCIICPQHGEFWQLAYDHLNGHGCSSCGTIQSHVEEEITSYLTTLIGEDNIIRHEKTILDGLEMDIFLPKFKMGIEYNGLHWHSEEFGKNNKYHIIKTKKALEKGIYLIQIFEDEWLEHKDLILDKLRHFLHKNTNKPIIGARKCVIIEIDKDKAKMFLEKYHIQGFAKSTCYYGAFYDNNLVGVMTFLKEKNGFWNLNRFATNINYSLPGLASKLFKYFLKHTNNVIEVKSFLDKRWVYGTQNLYTQLGFQLKQVLKPDYRYVVKYKRVHKFNFRKHILHKKYKLDLNLSELEMTKKIGLYRIWDCGLLKYIWTNGQLNVK